MIPAPDEIGVGGIAGLPDPVTWLIFERNGRSTVAPDLWFGDGSVARTTDRDVAVPLQVHGYSCVYVALRTVTHRQNE